MCDRTVDYLIHILDPSMQRVPIPRTIVMLLEVDFNKALAAWWGSGIYLAAWNVLALSKSFLASSASVFSTLQNQLVIDLQDFW